LPAYQKKRERKKERKKERKNLEDRRKWEHTVKMRLQGIG
jgi:hypothetical protein